MAKLKGESDEQLLTLEGSAYFNLFAIIPVINSLAIVSKQMGLTDLPREFAYPAIVLLPILKSLTDMQQTAQELMDSFARGQSMANMKSPLCIQRLSQLATADCSLDSAFTQLIIHTFEKLCEHRRIAPQSSRLAVLSHEMASAEELMPLLVGSERKASPSCKACKISMGCNEHLRVCTTRLLASGHQLIMHITSNHVLAHQIC